jgi:hypothetical protein
MRLRLVPVALVAFIALAPVRAADDGSVARLRKDLEYLTSDECEGRGSQTQGIHKAAEYIAAEFKRIGLKPGGTDGYFQGFRVQAGKATPGETNHLVLTGPIGQQVALTYDKQYHTLGMSKSGAAKAPLVFAGYGISTEGYDDYKGLDVAGKIVVVLRKTPPLNREGKPFAGQFGSLTIKLLTAATKKVAGVLFVNDPTEPRDALQTFNYTAAESPPVDFPSAQIHRGQLDEMLQASIGATLADVEYDIRRTGQPHSAALTGWSADFETSVIRPYQDVHNVIGIREGKGPLAKEYVVIGAHYDHLGRGERGSLERDETKRQLIHHGADDNGSGTVSVMEMARRFAGDPNYEGRTLVFMTFAGEEMGLLGSQHFCKNPTVTLEQIVAMVNLDMVGRLRPDKGKTKGKLEVIGVGTAKELKPMVEAENQKFDFDLTKTESPFGMLAGASDHASFADKKIPVLFMFTGLHTEYHRPSDTVNLINFDGMKKIVDFTSDLIGRLARIDRPAYVQTKRPATGRVSGVPRIGFMPGNYHEEDKGVLVGGVNDGGPAAKAGMKENDVIVQIAGKPVKNMTAYMELMRLQKQGQPVEVVVERGGKQVKLTVTPE